MDVIVADAGIHRLTAEVCDESAGEATLGPALEGLTMADKPYQG